MKLLLILLFICIPVFAKDFVLPSIIKIQGNTKLRSTSSFGRSTSNIIGLLTKGDVAKVIAVDARKRNGVGIKVKIINELSPNHGKQGWIYYHIKKKRRSFNIWDRKGEPLNLENPKDFKNYFRESSNLFNLDLFDLDTEDEIYKKIRKGDYKLLPQASDNPTEPLYYSVPYKTTDGKTSYHVRMFPKDRDTVNFKLLEKLNEKEETCTTQCPEEAAVSVSQPPHSDEKWLPGCKVLEENLDKKNYDALSKCLQSIKETVTKDLKLKKSNRTEIFTNLFLKLNPKEQEFAAMTLTAQGEAGTLAPPLEEMIIVMKVLENRLRRSKEMGKKDITALDVAMTPWQFSIFNSDDPGWKKVLKTKNLDQWDKKDLKNSLNAYIKFNKSTFNPSGKINKVYHYHTGYVYPKWSRGKPETPVRVNGVNVSTKKDEAHRFFYGIGGFRQDLSAFRKEADKLRENKK